MGVRLLVAVFLCLLVLFNGEVLGKRSESRNLTIADIPPCGVCYSSEYRNNTD